jgi:serine/threonine protein kinase
MKYKFINNLGKGSYGDVYLAENKDTKKVAIKKFPMYDKSSYMSFKNEIKILKKIKHKNLVKIYDYYKDRRNIYLVMEYAPLGDLDNYTRCLYKKHSSLDDDFVDNVISQVTEGIDYLHKNKIIHRDIKTSNILVFEKNLFKITDFGISKCMDSNRFAYTNIGTPYYMAPEIVCGQPYDFSVDYWALGCMIYKLLTKKYPFEARNIGALVLRIKRGMYNSNNIPYKYKQLLDKLLQSNRKDRGNKDTVYDYLKKICFSKNDTFDIIKDKELPKMKNKPTLNMIYNDYKIIPDVNKKNNILKPIIKDDDKSDKLLPNLFRNKKKYIIENRRYNHIYNYKNEIKKLDPIGKPIVDPIVNPIVNPIVKPIVDPIVNPIVKPIVKPTVDPIVNPMHNPRYNFNNKRKYQYKIKNIKNNKKKLKPIILKNIHNIKTMDMPMKNNKKDFIKFNKQNIILMHKKL